MTAADTTTFPGRALPWLLLLYCGANLLHFVHNAEYVTAYPNLPAWISRGSIYIAWCAIFAIGLWGYVLFRRSRSRSGLLLLTLYTALGLEGLLHYGRAPISGHSLGMNLTIWTEVVTAALALSTVLCLVAYRLLLGSKARNALNSRGDR